MSKVTLVIAVLIIGACFAACPTTSQAQTPVLSYPMLLWHPPSTRYDTVLQPVWVWSPSGAWYLENRYITVPRYIPGHYHEEYPAYPYWAAVPATAAKQQR